MVEEKMQDATPREIDLFLRYPTRKVIGIVDSPPQLDRLGQALTKAGFPHDSVEVFSGDQGLRGLDPAGVHSNLAGRLARVAESLGDGRAHMHRYELELLLGHFLVVVSTPDDGSKQLAREAFREGGGRRVDYYGLLTIEHLIP
jgi:hypothetical protein